MKIEDWLIDWYGTQTIKMTSSNKDEAISTTQLTLNVEDLSINTDDLQTIVCANCGKEGTNLNICNKCKAATYCNASCKKKHRSKHKQECEKRVAELCEEQLERERRAAELHDRELFKQPPPNEDCPICMLPLPELATGYKYKGCCGKMICSGCIHAVRIRDSVGLCPFCRTPAPDTDELVEQYKKRTEVDDAQAIRDLGCCYYHGMYGLPQNRMKALELWHQAAKLGHARPYYSIGLAHYTGNGVERNEEKASHYWELAAIGGDAQARFYLGALEGHHLGNHDRALKHWMIAVVGGSEESLSAIQVMFKHGKVTKEDYAKALVARQAYLDEVKSPQRDEAAVAFEDYKYY